MDAVVEALVAKVSVLLVSIRSAGEQSNRTVEYKPSPARSVLLLFSFFKWYFTMSFVSHVIVPTLLATNLVIAPCGNAPPLLAFVTSSSLTMLFRTSFTKNLSVHYPNKEGKEKTI